jgi:hypothetical protein
MAQFFAIYGTAMLVAGLLAGIVAYVKRRDYSYWMTVSLLFPPAILLLLLMPTNKGARPRRPGLDEEEERENRREEHDRLY